MFNNANFIDRLEFVNLDPNTNYLLSISESEDYSISYDCH